MEHKGYVFPDDLKYEKNHFWAKVEGDLVVTGATEFISKQAGKSRSWICRKRGTK